MATADGYISSDSSFYGSPPPSPPLDVEHYLSYASRLPATLAAQHDLKTLADDGLDNTVEDQNDPNCQPSESAAAFVKRIPPSKPPASSSEPDTFLWCTGSGASKQDLEDTAAFVRDGRKAQLDFLEIKSDTAAELDKKGRSSDLYRTLTKPREKLVAELKKLARKHNVKTGKWMLFCSPAEVDAIWQRVCEGILSGKLGNSAKVARRGTSKRSGDAGATDAKEEQVICVYTKDFEDQKGVKRVLEGLRELGLVKSDDDRGIWYKADAWTYLEIHSGNEFGIKASLFGSKEMLAKRGRRT